MAEHRNACIVFAQQQLACHLERGGQAAGVPLRHLVPDRLWAVAHLDR